MRETAKRNISLILVILFFGGACYVFFNYSWPALMEVFSLTQELNSKKEEYAKQTQGVKLAKEIINQYKNLTNINQMISSSLPKGEEIYNVIKQLNNISQKSGILIEDISLNEISQLQNETPEIKPEIEILTKSKIFTFELTLLGSYESFKTWLEAIESNIRLMDITKITLNPISLSEKSTPSNANIFNFKVTVNLYYQ